MATGVKEGIEHQVTIEDAGPSRKRLTFTVPASVVAEHIENSMSALSANAVLPGFRAGRAPRRLIEKRFGESVRHEAKSQIVASVYSQAVEEHKIHVIGEPEGNEALANLVLDPSRDMTFHVEVDVMPEFQLPSMEGLEVLRPIIEPTEQQVDDQIRMLAVNEGSLEPRPRAEPGDYCIGHGLMKDTQGEKLIEIEGAVIQVPPPEKKGQGAILGVMVEDFGRQVGTPTPGETVEVRTKGPENHEDEKVRGKDLVISFRVDQVQRIIPCPMDELLRRTGTRDEAHLREATLARLRQRALIEQQAAMRRQVAEHLIESIEVPLPQKLTTRQAQANLARARMELLYRGYDEHQIEERMAAIRAASAAAAVRDLKLTFILARLAQEMKVQATQDEVLHRIAQMAAERRIRPDAMRQELEKRNQVGFVVQQVREHKTLDALVSRAKVKDVPLEEFNRLVAPKNA